MGNKNNIILGCVADDFTGASDVASFLADQGIKTVLFNGIPNTRPTVLGKAIIVALKTRTQETASAIEDTLEAFKWLKEIGANQFYLKYCSTFDSTKQGNNVITLQPTRYMDYASRNQLLPLDDFIKSKVIDISDFSQKMIDAGKLNGATVFVANGNSSKGLFYNADLLKRVNVQPLKFDISWEEFAAKGAEFKKAINNPNIYFVDDPTAIDASKEIFGYFLRQRGKDVYSKDGKLGFEQQDMIDWFQYWDDLRKKGIIPPASLVGEYKGKSAQESMIAKGVVAASMSAGGSSQMAIHQVYMKDQLELVRIPTLPNGKSGEDIGGILLSIYTKSAHPKEAAQLINYLVNDVDGAKIFKLDAGPSPSKKINEAVKPALTPANIKVNEFQEKANQYFSVPNTPAAGNNEVFKQIGLAAEAIAFQKKTIPQAVDDFFKEASKILK